jgi:hypothetical protein
MSKKIKITEEQLKTIMERRHTYQMDTNEEEVTDMDQLDDKDQGEVDVKEPENIKEGFGRDISVQMAIWSHLSDMEYDSPERRKTRCNFIKLLVAKYISRDIEVNEDKLDNLWDQVSNRDFSGSALDDVSEEPTKDMPGFEGTMDGLDSLSIREDDDMMNESIKKIKSNFKRFL